MITAYCYERADEIAFTKVEDGSNLPDAHTWEPYRRARSIEVGDSRFVDIEADQLDREIFERLQAGSFFITSAERAQRRVHVADRP
jgi:hypothetical protein